MAEFIGHQLAERHISEQGAIKPLAQGSNEANWEETLKYIEDVLGGRWESDGDYNLPL